MSTQNAATNPAKRSDARRNRAAVLDAALVVLAEEGIEAPMDRVARRAGVGAGTVYRHFPSKDQLVEAVVVAHIDELVDAAARWTAQAPADAALFGYLDEVVAKSARRHHLCELLAVETGWPRTELTAANRRFHLSLGRLLRQARRSGAVDADLRVADLAALITAGATLRATHPDRARGARLARQVVGGLRRTVTEPSPFRDTATHPGHASTSCRDCGAPLTRRSTGRPRLYCGPACRQRAHRRRSA